MTIVAALVILVLRKSMNLHELKCTVYTPDFAFSGECISTLVTKQR